MGCSHSADGEEIECHACMCMPHLFHKSKVPLAIQCAHFTPAFFPLIPIVSPRTAALCSESWKKIVDFGIVDPTTGVNTAGITVFYNEFYEHLDKVDSSGKFDKVLAKYSSGQNKIAAKGAILVRIIKFVLAIEHDSNENQDTLYELGRSHNYKNVRPWQYSVFIQTLLLTISARLGVEASNEVMDAWVNLFAYVLKGMLPAAIDGLVMDSEFSLNKAGMDVATPRGRKRQEKKPEKKASSKVSASKSGFSDNRGASNGRESANSRNSATESMGVQKRNESATSSAFGPAKQYIQTNTADRLNDR